jgi:hypothetical protein
MRRELERASGSDEGRRAFVLSALARSVQRRLTVPVCLVEVRPSRDEHLHARCLSLKGCSVQRAAELAAQVDVGVGIDEQLHSARTAVPTSHDERCAAIVQPLVEARAGSEQRVHHGIVALHARNRERTRTSLRQRVMDVGQVVAKDAATLGSTRFGSH